MTKTTIMSIATLLAGAVVAAGCGGDEKRDKTRGDFPRSAGLRQQVAAATASTAAEFPAVNGRTLDEVSSALDGTGTQAIPATSDFTVGENRLAFGVLDQDAKIVYGKTAVYVADTPGGRARGPYPAPADLLLTEPAFRSRQAATEQDPFAAIYATSVPFRRAGNTPVLVVTKLSDGRLVGSGLTVKVIKKSADRVVAVGDRPPKVATDTRTSAGGNMKAIDTRMPVDDMHEDSFDDVLGKKPVALLFATPQLCQSRVCGPVVDIAAQLKATYGDRMTFIHQEVYVNNNPNKGLREPLQRFGLQTEPWLFVADRRGVVTARLEGSFGFDAMKTAIETGLR